MGYDINNFPVQTYVGCIKQQYIIRYTWYVISTSTFIGAVYSPTIRCYSIYGIRVRSGIPP